MRGASSSAATATPSSSSSTAIRHRQASPELALGLPDQEGRRGRADRVAVGEGQGHVRTEVAADDRGVSSRSGWPRSRPRCARRRTTATDGTCGCMSCRASAPRRSPPSTQARSTAVCGAVGRRPEGSRRGGLSPRTVRYIHTILAQGIQGRREVGRLARNPPTQPTHPKRERPAARSRSPGRPISYAPSWREPAAVGIGPPIFCWPRLDCGAAKPLGLRWPDLDLDAGRASIRQTVIAVKHTAMIGHAEDSEGSAYGHP